MALVSARRGPSCSPTGRSGQRSTRWHAATACRLLASPSVQASTPAFNPSKHVTTEGRPRWPTTESLAKVLSATGATLDEFVDLLDEGPTLRKAPQPIPLIGLTQAGAG